MVEIVKSPLDDRQYRHLVLPNQLEVLLVQDGTADTGAAALSVRVGSYEDPEDLPGLAHFLEHLLFMGTAKYPDESEYSQFLSEHAGKSNAYTSAEQTNYHFEVGWQHLEGALDRFAQFFIAPLFNRSSKDREIMAVDSENKRNLQSDLWRFFQLEKSLSNPAHPIAKFATGNYDTLGRIPTERGVDVRQRLIQFYKAHYSASIMKLVVIGRQGLDELEGYVRTCFADVPNAHPELAARAPAYAGLAPLRPQDLGVVVKARPVMDVNMIELTFPIPDQQPLHETHPFIYYVNLLGHESRGSLLFYLKERRWATEVTSVISHICKGTDYLYLNVELTNDGLAHWRDVVAAAFGYIEMARRAGPQAWFFEEQRRTSQAAFLYRQKSRAMPLASSLAQVLHRPIPRHRLLNYSVLQRYDEAQLRAFAQHLTPDNVLVMVVSPSFTDLDRRERWYGTEYTTLPLGPVVPLDSPELHLPRANDFLTSNFELAVESPGPPQKQARPRLLANTPELKLWHKLDDQFKVPKAHIFVKIVHAAISNSAHLIRLADLFTAMVNDLLADYAYYADVADVSMGLTTVQDGLEIEVHGFSDKLDQLLRLVVETIYEGKLEQSRFELVKEQQHRQLSNLVLAQPDAQRTIQTGYLLLEKLYPLDARLAALHAITFADLLDYVHGFRTTPRGIEVLVCGNKTSAQAHQSAGLVRAIMARALPPHPPPLDHSNSTDHVRNTSFLFEEGSNQFRQVHLADPENVNSALLLGFQFGEVDLERSATLSIVSQLLKEATFSQLRTKEQLGYVVLSTKSQTRSTLWFNVFVQSEEPTEFLEDRVENYLRNVARPLIVSLTDAEYAKHVQALVCELQEANKNLTEEAIRFWSAINSGFYDFTRRKRLANIALAVTKAQVLAAFDRYVLEPRTRSRFALHLRSHRRKRLEPEVALSRAIGQLVTDRQVPVTPAEIQGFMAECRGLAPADALQKLAGRLTADKGFTPAAAQEFVAAAVHKSQEMLAASTQAAPAHRPSGREITSLPDYYARIKLARRAEPVDPLESFTTYEDGPKL